MFNYKIVSMFTGLLLALMLLLPSAMPSDVLAQTNLVSVDWAADSVLDGNSTGTLGGMTLTQTSTDGESNGGSNLSLNWTTNPATNNVPGIGTSPGVVNEAGIFDWNNNTPGTVTLDFGGYTVRDPILMMVFLSPNIVDTIDFQNGIPITILDDDTGAGVTVASGNVVTTDGTHGDSSTVGFAIELYGDFTSITFATNINSAAGPQSIAFTLAAYNDNIYASTPPSRSVGGVAEYIELDTTMIDQPATMQARNEYLDWRLFAVVGVVLGLTLAGGTWLLSRK